MKALLIIAATVAITACGGKDVSFDTLEMARRHQAPRRCQPHLARRQHPGSGLPPGRRLGLH